MGVKLTTHLGEHHRRSFEPSSETKYPGRLKNPKFPRRSYVIKGEQSNAGLGDSSQPGRS